MNQSPAQNTEQIRENNLKQAVPFFRVSDMERSLNFYVQGLGFELINHWSPEGRIKWCWLEREGVALMLQEYREELRPEATTGAGITVYFICRDALKIYEEFRQKQLYPEEPFVGNQMWVTSISDPDAYKLDFESPTDIPEETKYSDWMIGKRNQI